MSTPEKVSFALNVVNTELQALKVYLLKAESLVKAYSVDVKNLSQKLKQLKPPKYSAYFEAMSVYTDLKVAVDRNREMLAIEPDTMTSSTGVRITNPKKVQLQNDIENFIQMANEAKLVLDSIVLEDALKPDAEKILEYCVSASELYSKESIAEGIKVYYKHLVPKYKKLKSLQEKLQKQLKNMPASTAFNSPLQTQDTSITPSTNATEQQSPSQGLSFDNIFKK